MRQSIQNQINMITNYNYWWKDLHAREDPDLRIVQANHLHYAPAPIAMEECEKHAVFTLRGPRRVGKSIAIKQLIMKLIHDAHWAARDIVWLTAETIRTMRDFEEILVEVVTAHHPRLLCIDEVSGIKGWQNVVKKLVDVGYLSKCCVILTGSSAYDIKSGSEKMAGRRGMVSHPDRILLPMSFQTFLVQLRRFWPGMAPSTALDYYLISGGFPFRVQLLIESLMKQEPFDPFSGLSILDDVLFYEIQRRKLDRSIALEILSRLASNGPHALSYQSFANALSISKDSVRRYLDALGDAFLVATISSYDTGRGRVAPKKDRKFMWIDPALSFVAEAIGQGPSWDPPARAEILVLTCLLRSSEQRLWEGLAAPRNVFTWKSSGGNEVDFLMVNRAKKILEPIEVKYQDSVSDWDFQVMERAFGKGTIVGKSTTKIRSKSKCIPISDFLD